MSEHRVIFPESLTTPVYSKIYLLKISFSHLLPRCEAKLEGNHTLKIFKKKKILMCLCMSVHENVHSSLVFSSRCAVFHHCKCCTEA